MLLTFNAKILLMLRVRSFMLSGTSHFELAARAIPCREERVTIQATGITDLEI